MDWIRRADNDRQCSIVYLRCEDSQHHKGVAGILRKGMEESLLEWKPISSRLMRARLRGRHTNITLIQSERLSEQSEQSSLNTMTSPLSWET